MGATKNKYLLIIVGIVCSFTNSFMASAKGWAIPIIDTLFGPLRNW